VWLRCKFVATVLFHNFRKVLQHYPNFFANFVPKTSGYVLSSTLSSNMKLFFASDAPNYRNFSSKIENCCKLYSNFYGNRLASGYVIYIELTSHLMTFLGSVLYVVSNPKVWEVRNQRIFSLIYAKNISQNSIYGASYHTNGVVS